ncbi:unnamed protein product [Parnassius mnemosyne]|uniref:Uncharacterized protein n=1 Tax=Parnassius mnemosyne TaxID=213953 RepID=A0AAV1KR82_9NEOP
MKYVEDFMNKFLTYESHYSRRYTTKKYLHQDLNITLLYNLYKEDVAKKNSEIKNCEDEYKKENLKEELNAHQKKAELHYSAKRADKELSKDR